VYHFWSILQGYDAFKGHTPGTGGYRMFQSFGLLAKGEYATEGLEDATWEPQSLADVERPKNTSDRVTRALAVFSEIC
jgi:hypothetical protein